MYKKIILFLCTILLLFPSINTPLASSDYDELNWYYVPSKNHETPEGAKEASSILKENNAFYLGDVTQKEIFLTFDEGYENGNTMKILDILKELDIKAAFFVVKPYIDTEPDIIKRMALDGHLVCNHSNHHPSMASIKDTEKFNDELLSVEKAYKDLTGNNMPKYFRPPMGKYSKNSLELTNKLGYKTIFWSFAYKDWLVDSQPSCDFAIDKIKSNVHNGEIMLLHAVSDTNTKVLKEVLSSLVDEGYTFKTLDEL